MLRALGREIAEDGHAIDRATSPNRRLHVPARIGSGVALYRLGNYLAAQFAFQTALTYDPNNQLAAANLAAARQAEEAQRTQQRLAYEQQERERSAAVSNAIGAFVSTYSAVETARLQAEAEAAARAQAQAQAQAQARAAQQQASATPPQQPASTAPSSGSDAQTGASIFLNPQTGRPCVTPVRTYNETRSEGDVDYYWVFRNTCDRTFRIFTVRQVVDPSHSPHQSMGIYPNSEASMVCTYRSRNLPQSCRGFVSYEVR